MAFTQTVTFPPGVTESPAAAIPNGVLGCDVSLSSGGWPAGTYQLDVMLSIDGGVTFPLVASMVMPSPPITFKGGPYRCRFDLVGATPPTHAKARITAPAAFTTTITLTPS